MREGRGEERLGLEPLSSWSGRPSLLCLAPPHPPKAFFPSSHPTPLLLVPQAKHSPSFCLGEGEEPAISWNRGAEIGQRRAGVLSLGGA